jgi:hypothetical protein
MVRTNMPDNKKPEQSLYVDGHNDYLLGLMKFEQKMTKHYWAISVLSMSVFAIATASTFIVYPELDELVELPVQLGLTLVFRLLADVSLVTFYNGVSRSPFVAFIDAAQDVSRKIKIEPVIKPKVNKRKKHSRKISQQPKKLPYNVYRNTYGSSDQKKAVKVKDSGKGFTPSQFFTLFCSLSPLVLLCDAETFWDTVIKQYSDSLVLFFLTAPLLWSTQFLIAKKLLKSHSGKAHNTLNQLFLNDAFIDYQKYKDSWVSIDATLPFLLGLRDAFSVHFPCPLMEKIALNSGNKALHVFSVSIFSLLYHYVAYSFYRDFLYQKLDKTLSGDPCRHAGAFLVFFSVTSSIISLYALGDFGSWASSLIFLFDTVLFSIAMYVDVVSLKTSEKLLQEFSAITQEISVADIVKENKKAEYQPKPKPTPTPKPKPKPTPKQQSKTSARRRSHGILDSTHLVMLQDIITAVNDITKKCFGVSDAIEVNPFKTASVPTSGGKTVEELTNKFISFHGFYRQNLRTIRDTHMQSFAAACQGAITRLCVSLQDSSNGQGSHVKDQRLYVTRVIDDANHNIALLSKKCDTRSTQIKTQLRLDNDVEGLCRKNRERQVIKDAANAQMLEDVKLFRDYCNQYATLTGPFALSHGEGNLKDRRFSSTTFPFRNPPGKHLTDYFYTQLVPAIVKIASLLDLQVYISGYAANYPAYIGKGDLDLKIFGVNDRLPDAVEIFKHLLTRFISQNLKGEYNEQASTGTTSSSLYGWQEHSCDPAVACSATLKTDYELPQIDITVCRGQADVGSPLNLTTGLLQLCINNTTPDTELSARIQILHNQFDRLNKLSSQYEHEDNSLREICLQANNKDILIAANDYRTKIGSIKSFYDSHVAVAEGMVNHLSIALIAEIKSKCSSVFFSHRVKPMFSTLAFFEQLRVKSLVLSYSHSDYVPQTVRDLLYLLKNLARNFKELAYDYYGDYLRQENVSLITDVFIHHFNSTGPIWAQYDSYPPKFNLSDLCEFMKTYLGDHFAVANSLLRELHQQNTLDDGIETRLGDFLASLPSPETMNPNARPFTPSF